MSRSTLIVATLIPILAALTFGPGVGASEPVDYQGQDVPDRIALRWLADIASSNGENAVSFVASTLGIETGEASQIVMYLANLHRDWVSRRKSLDRQIACDGKRRWPSGAEACRVWNLLDEAHDALDAEHLVVAKSDLGLQGSERLERLLAELKEGMHIRVESVEHAFGGSQPQHASEALIALCDGRI